MDSLALSILIRSESRGCDPLAIVRELSLLNWDDVRDARRAQQDAYVASLMRKCSGCAQRFSLPALESVRGDCAGFRRFCAACLPAEIARLSRKCALCDATFIRGNCRDIDLCEACKSPDLIAEWDRLYSHLRRPHAATASRALALRSWLAILAVFGRSCAYCGGAFWCLEHMEPLSVGGDTSSANCVPACRACDRRKSKAPRVQIDRIFGAGTDARITESLRIAAAFVGVAP